MMKNIKRTLVWHYYLSARVAAYLLKAPKGVYFKEQGSKDSGASCQCAPATASSTPAKTRDWSSCHLDPANQQL
jgi:hypothetical protein